MAFKKPPFVVVAGPDAAVSGSRNLRICGAPGHALDPLETPTPVLPKHRGTFRDLGYRYLRGTWVLLYDVILIKRWLCCREDRPSTVELGKGVITMTKRKTVQDRTAAMEALLTKLYDEHSDRWAEEEADGLDPELVDPIQAIPLEDWMAATDRLIQAKIDDGSLKPKASKTKKE